MPAPNNAYRKWRVLQKRIKLDSLTNKTLKPTNPLS